MTTAVITVGCVGDQPVLNTGLAVVSCFMKSINPHCERLKQVLNDVSVRAVEVTTEVCSSEGGEILHATDEKPRVRDTVFSISERDRPVGSRLLYREFCILRTTFLLIYIAAYSHISSFSIRVCYRPLRGRF